MLPMTDLHKIEEEMDHEMHKDPKDREEAFMEPKSPVQHPNLEGLLFRSINEKTDQL